MPTRYYLRLPDAERARGDDATLAFRSQSAEGIAAELQDALRGDALFQRWRARQDDPDAVDSALGATDPGASVQGSQHDLHVELRALSVVDSTDFASMDATKILLKSAPLNVRAPPLVAPRSGFMKYGCNATRTDEYQCL